MTLASLRRVALAATLALCLSAAALASTWVVDDDGGPGVDFTDIQPAVDAAAPGDVILVHPGSYSSFVLTKGVTILGAAPGVSVASGSRVSLLPAAQRAVLARMSLIDLRVLSCSGVVVLDEIVLPFPVQTGFSRLLTVEGSTDVRLFGCTVDQSSFGSTGKDGFQASASRVEVVQSLVRGDGGVDTQCGSAGPGGRALVATQGTRLHVVSSDLLGGEGGSNLSTCVSFCNLGAGDGADGLAVLGATSLGILAGLPSRNIQGGFAGNGGECDCDGAPGAGLRVVDGLVVHSGTTIQGGGGFCFGGGPAIVESGTGAAALASPPMPHLELVGSPVPGQTIRFIVRGEAGDSVALKLGRNATLIQTPGVQIEQLTTEERSFALGVLAPGADPNASMLFPIPPGWPAGFTLHAQAELTGPIGVQRTNSVPIVIR